MKRYSQLLKELPSKKVVFAFGRFQPPTTGHELLVKAVQKLASAQKADHVIYASKTEDKKQNPLPVSRKVYYLQRMFPGVNFKAANEQVRTFIEAAKELNKKYKNIVMVAGSDRVAEYKKILEKYNGTEFNFDTVTVVSAGERDPDSDNAAGMSGTKMREAAKAGKFNEFKKGVPKTLTDLDARRLMNEIRKAYDLAPIKESINGEVDELREKYFRGEIFNVGDLVVCENKFFTVVKRGSNHLLLQEQGTEMKFTRWLRDVKLAEDFENPEDHNQISWQGYTTKHFDLDPAVVDAFNNTIHNSNANHVDILHAIKEVDEYLGHLKAAIATKQASPESVNNVKEHIARAKEHLNKSDATQHHVSYLKDHEDQIERFASDYKEAGKEDMADSFEQDGDLIENLTNKTLKPSSADQIKAARIIATTLGVENVESTTNPEQIVNMGLRKIKNKALNAESYEILRRMLKMATDIGIEFDTTLMPQKLKEAYYDKLLSYDAEGKLTEIDADHDGIPDWIEKNFTKIGHSLDNTQDDQLRKQKVMYHLGEAQGDPKKMAREVAKAALAAKHAREKEALSKKQEVEKERISEENIDESSLNPKDPHGDYKAKSKALHDLSMNKDVDQKHVQQRKLDLDKEYSKYRKEEVELQESQAELNKHISDFSKGVKSSAAKQSTYKRDNKPIHNMKHVETDSDHQKVFNHLKKMGYKKTSGYDPKPNEFDMHHNHDSMTTKSDPVHHASGVSAHVEKEHGGKLKVHFTHRGIKEENIEEDYVQAADKKIGKDGKKHAARLIKIGSDGPGEQRSNGNDRFSEETEEEIKLSDADIDAIVNGHTDWEHIVDAYEDDELAIVDDETGEELEDSLKEETLNEVLSRIERIKAKTRFARSKSKRMVKAKIALKRSSPQPVINKRARRLAIKAIKQRIAKKPLSTLSVAEKERLEQRIAKMKPVLNRIAMKLAPRVRQIEKARLSHSKYTK